MAQPKSETRRAPRGGSGFEKTGGYASAKEPVESLPKVPSGPAPGAGTKK